MKARNLPMLAYNWISAIGSALSIVSGVTLVLLLGISFLAEEHSNPYFGIFLYVVLPAALAVGLTLIPIGMLREWKRWNREGAPTLPRFPVIDFNRKSHRNATIVFFLGSAILIPLAGIGSFQAYEYSESVEFCGTTCHEVMEPEYVTYVNSPHARVACAECHIGSGADWFVKAKISGAYQVYATLANKYPRPVPTPIEDLRPAEDTCEKCHWPEKFFGLQWREYNHYMYDDANTAWPVAMLMKIGGGDPRQGNATGIHWHMNIGIDTEYIARDEKRLDIPWIRVYDRYTGRQTIYQDENNPLTEEEIAAATPRTMDCIDCHNRPSHIYHSPDESMDRALHNGHIRQSVPGIKEIAVEALTGEYATKDEALAEIAEILTDHYRIEHPDYWKSNESDVDQAIVVVQEIYSENFFPGMKASWAEYPNHIGHFDDVGCMRCHMEDKVSESGARITRDCEVCHLIAAQGSGEQRQVATGTEGLDFLHPEDLGEIWREMACSDCHGGTQP